MNMWQVLLVCGLIAGNLAIAVSPVHAQAADPERFFAMDVFGGGVPRSDPDENEEDEFVSMSGWQLGASVRILPQLRWLELVGDVGRHANDDVRVRDVLGGVRTTSPWAFGNDVLVRGFAHVLAGYAWAQPRSGLGERAPELAIGAGFDIFFLRIQADYVRTDFDSVPHNAARGFVGGVLPLCFSGCRPEWEDGITFSRNRARPVPAQQAAW